MKWSWQFVTNRLILESVFCGTRGNHFGSKFAAVAQLVEHNVANVVVVGSNPISRSSLPLVLFF